MCSILDKRIVWSLCRITIEAFEAQASGPAPRGAPHLLVAPLRKGGKKERMRKKKKREKKKRKKKGKEKKRKIKGKEKKKKKEKREKDKKRMERDKK